MDGKRSDNAKYLIKALSIKCLQCTNDKVQVPIKSEFEDAGQPTLFICNTCKRTYNIRQALGIKLVELEKRIKKLEDKPQHFL